MTTKPWLSVITPVYNGDAYLSSALDSIVAQGDPNIECIVIDGMSTDSTLPILKSYQDRLPINIYKKDISTNWVVKTNYALSLAKGEYICFLHHDDLWFKHRLRKMKQLTEQFPKAVLLVHPSNYLGTDGKIVGLWSCPLPAYPKIIQPTFILERLLTQNFISILGPVFKRDVAVESGGLDDTLWYTADWDFWLKIVLCGETVYWPEPLSGFRIHPSSQTIVRSSHTKEFRNQLEIVVDRYFTYLEVSEPLKRKIRKVVEFSMEVNIALASTVHGKKQNLVKLIVSFVMLGPSGWYRYLRDSRIWERVTARLRANLITRSQK